MAYGEAVQDRLRAILQFIERADLEGIRAKQQVGRMLAEDYQVGAEIQLVACVFWVEGVAYRATLTPQQRDVILAAAANGTTDEVLYAIQRNIVADQIMEGAVLALNILVAALTNQPFPLYEEWFTALTPKINPPGACQFSSGCVSPFDATLCQNQGGEAIPYCPRKDRDDSHGDDGKEAKHAHPSG
jgi:hypothetical protein